MPKYEIFMKEARTVQVDGDKIDVMTTSMAGGRELLDLVIHKENRVVAHFRRGEWVGYSEKPPAEK
jgi:hypothetical protein